MFDGADEGGRIVDTDGHFGGDELQGRIFSSVSTNGLIDGKIRRGIVSTMRARADRHFASDPSKPQRRTTRAIGALRILDAFARVCPQLQVSLCKSADFR